MRFVWLLAFVAIACSKVEAVLTYEQQLAHDTKIIDDFIKSENIQNVIRVSRGIRYVIHTGGGGPRPDGSSYLKVRYVETLIPSKTVVGNSSEPPHYAADQLRSFILGWRIAFDSLRQGTTATIFIPSVLAYGHTGIGSIVPPDANLMFHVDFIDFYNEGIVTDGDSNPYTQVLVKDQLWLDNNFKTTKFSNGALIDPGLWSAYNNDPNFGSLYGKLYSYSVVTDPKNICPAGYKIPSRSEWERFAETVNSGQLIGLELLPGGNREANGTYSGEGIMGAFWASDNLGGSNALTYVYSATNHTLVQGVVSADVQASVRCIKGY